MDVGVGVTHVGLPVSAPWLSTRGRAQRQQTGGAATAFNLAVVSRLDGDTVAAGSGSVADVGRGIHLGNECYADDKNLKLLLPGASCLGAENSPGGRSEWCM